MDDYKLLVLVAVFFSVTAILLDRLLMLFLHGRTVPPTMSLGRRVFCTTSMMLGSIFLGTSILTAVFWITYRIYFNR